MPHDKNGKQIQQGDIVNLRCRVDQVQAGEDACNVNLIALDGNESDYKPSIACNARSLELVQPPAAIAA